MAITEKKFLDSAGVSTLWGKVLEKVKAEETRAKGVEEGLGNRLTTAEGHITTLTGAADVAGSVAEAKAAADAKVASVAATDKSVVVAGTATAPTVGVQISKADGNALTLAEDGLKVTVPAATDYTVTVTESSPEGYAKAYTIAQAATGLNTTINIPKDMVVQSGTVEVNPAGQAAGTYLVLTLANATEDKVYINVGDLIEYVTSGSAVGDQIVVAVSADHKVTATLSNDSVTKEQLVEGVRTSLGLADSALQKADITTGSANGTIAVEGTDVEVKGLGTAAYQNVDAFDAKGSAAAVLGTAEDTKDANTVYGAKAYAKDYADGLAGNYDTKGAATQALNDAKAYTDSEVNAKIIALTSEEVLAAIAAAEQA